MLSNQHEHKHRRKHKHEQCASFVIGLSTCPRRECRRFSGHALVATRRFGYQRNRLSHCPKFVFAAQVPIFPRNPKRPRDRRNLGHHRIDPKLSAAGCRNASAANPAIRKGSAAMARRSATERSALAQGSHKHRGVKQCLTSLRRTAARTICKSYPSQDAHIGLRGPHAYPWSARFPPAPKVLTIS